MSRALVLVVALGLVAGASAQAVHKVPQDHETIQAAVDAAADGDTILISAGTYPESVLVEGLSNLLIRGKGKVIIAPAAGDGLVLDTCTACTVEKIRVQGGDTGIRLVSTSESELSKCRVEDTNMDGIRIEAGDHDLLDSCTVTDPSGNGIVLINVAATFPSDVTLDHCKVSGATVDGIVITGDQNIVDHCKVVQPQGRGILCDDTTHCNEDSITHCSVTKGGSDGIAISGVSLVVTACKVVSCHNVGIFDEGGFLDEINGCKVTKAGTVGIATGLLTVQVSIHDCKVTASTGDGIALTGMGHEVADNKVTKAGEDGIDISAGGCNLTSNKANGDAGDGFRLSAGANHNQLSGNKAHGNGNFDFEDVSGDGTNEVDTTNNFGTVGP